MKNIYCAFILLCMVALAGACSYGKKTTDNIANANFTPPDTPMCVTNELAALAAAKNLCINKLNQNAELYNKVRADVLHWNLWTGLVTASGAVATSGSAIADKIKGGDQSAFVIASGVATGVVVPVLITVRDRIGVDEDLSRRSVAWDTVRNHIDNADALVQELLPNLNACEDETKIKLRSMATTLTTACN